jgi:hypothetical protein
MSPTFDPGPSTDHAVAFKVEWGEELLVLEQADGWARVEHRVTGKVGCIRMGLTSTTKPTHVGSGRYDRHVYTFRRDKNRYAVRFEPTLPRDDATVIGAMMELINVVYGEHLLLELTPKLVARGGTNLIQFKGVNHYYYFLLVKEDTGEVSAFSMWREAPWRLSN